MLFILHFLGLRSLGGNWLIEQTHLRKSSSNLFQKETNNIQASEWQFYNKICKLSIPPTCTTFWGLSFLHGSHPWLPMNNNFDFNYFHVKVYKTGNEKLKVSKATQKFRVKMSKWTNQNMAKFPESLILNLLFTSLFINITVFQKIHRSIYHSMFSISIFINIIMFLVAQICRFFAVKELYIIGTKTTKSKNWISLTCFVFLIIVGHFLLWVLPQHLWTVSFITNDFNICKIKMFWKVMREILFQNSYSQIAINNEFLCFPVPFEWLTLWFNMPFMLLFSDIRQGLFYGMLMCFWVIFTGEHLMVGII